MNVWKTKRVERKSGKKRRFCIRTTLFFVIVAFSLLVIFSIFMKKRRDRWKLVRWMSST